MKKKPILCLVPLAKDYHLKEDVINDWEDDVDFISIVSIPCRVNRDDTANFFPDYVIKIYYNRIRDWVIVREPLR